MSLVTVKQLFLRNRGDRCYDLALVSVKDFANLTMKYLYIKILEHYGIRGIAKKWLISYLSNRRQFTSIGNKY